MVTSLAEMIARYRQPGVVRWIGLRPARKAPMEIVQQVEIGPDGLAGDRAKAGKRAVTLIQAEHLPAIAGYLGRDAVTPDDLRRNVMVSGLNLASLKGREVQVGSAVLLVEGLCAPCSRMEATFGPGGYAAVRGHGGWYASVVSPGAVALGDAVTPLDAD